MINNLNFLKLKKVKIYIIILISFISYFMTLNLVRAQSQISFQAVIKNTSNGDLLSTAQPALIKVQYLGYHLSAGSPFGGAGWCVVAEEAFSKSIQNGFLDLTLGSGDFLSPGIPQNIGSYTGVLPEFLLEASLITNLNDVINRSNVTWDTHCKLENAVDNTLNWSAVSSHLNLSSTRAIRLNIQSGGLVLKPFFKLNTTPYSINSLSTQALTGSMGAQINDILKWDGNSWLPSPLTLSGQDIDNASISGQKLAPLTIEGSHIQLGTITADHVANLSLDDSKISGLNWSKISNKPTTISGYGITDAVSASNLNQYVAKAGDTMSGALELPSNGLVVGTNQLVLASGMVGIGTAIPSHPLTVAGSTVGVGNGVVEFNTGNNRINIGVSNNTGAATGPIVVGRSNVGNYDNAVVFGLSNNITGGPAFNPILMGRSNAATSAQDVIAMGRDNTISANSGIAIGRSIVNNVSSSLMIGPSDTAKVTILSSGFVGVGNTNPSAQLDIVGGINFRAPSSALDPSPANEGRIYYDSVTNKFKISENGGAYSDLIASSSWSTTSGSDISYTAGRVGVGIASPGWPLHVVGTPVDFGSVLSVADSSAAASGVGGGVAFRGLFSGSNYSTYGIIRGYKNNGTVGDSGGGLKFYTRPSGSALSERMRISAGGQVSIASTNSTYPLEVGGDVNIASSGVLRFNGTQVCDSTGCTSSSDRRLKKDIVPLENSLEKILVLTPVRYSYKDQSQFGNKEHIGLIAQDLEKVYPQAVVTDANSGLKSVAYSHLVAPLIGGIKKLHHKLLEFESQQMSKNQELDNKIENTQILLKEKEHKIQQLENELTQMKLVLCEIKPEQSICK